jgi:fumarate hydratase, class II
MLESVHLLATASRNFADACVKGIEADKERCESLVEQSLAMCTPLAPVIGYDKAAEVAKRAYKEGKTVREVAREVTGLSEKELSEIFNLHALTEPGIRGKGGE